VLLKVPRKEYQRVLDDKGVTLSVDVGFYREGDDGKFESCKEGEVLRTGEAFAFFVRPSGNCHLYALQIDSLGKLPALPERGLRHA